MKIQFSFLCILTCFSMHAQTGMWTWMKGSNLPNPPGSYGTRGVSSATNNPPGLYEATEWTDQQHKFWLFGGLDSAFKDESTLWRFDPQTNNWTWMKGLQPPASNIYAGNYGTKGIASPLNNPGARGYCSASWVDKQGSLWLFGGTGYDSAGSYGELADLWKYDIATNNWTWMAGPNTAGSLGVYGPKGIAGPSYSPSGRHETNATWTDNNGNLWLFGGLVPVTGADPVNDIWKFNTGTNMWSWEGGGKTVPAPANYGTKGIAAASNQPPARQIYSKWKDMQGNFWMFGGADDKKNINFNDLWKYDLGTGFWTWVSGSDSANAKGSYGFRCQPSNTNAPPSRYENRACWTDACGNFWMFGGWNYPLYITFSDLWYYNVPKNQWTWVGGSDTVNITGRWNTRGVAALGNTPGNRNGALPFTDSLGNFWFWGGLSVSTTFNDLWRYTPDTTCIQLGSSCIQNFRADFTSTSISGCEPLIVHFTDLSPGSSSWKWRFGDGATSAQQNPTHTYVSSGQYAVSLVAGNGTKIDSLKIANYIQVYARVPAHFLASADTACVGQIVNYTGNSPGAISVLWNFMDNTANSTLVNPSHAWTMPGSYQVRFITYSAAGCNDTAWRTIFIKLPPSHIQAGFSPNPTSGCFPLTVNFSNASSGASTYTWNFGDGQSSNLINPAHTYTVAGSYQIKLVVGSTSSCGHDMDSASYFPIVVKGPTAPSLDFSADTLGCVPFTANFTNNSVNASSYSWNFGDGSSSTLSSPIHTYSQAGVYSIALHGYNPGPCGPDSALIVKSNYITVLARTPAHITASSDSACISQPLNFTGGSTGTTSVHWDFNDGTSSANPNPVHAWINAGTDTVTFITYSAAGCTDTAKLLVTIVAPGPVKAAFTPGPASGCFPLTVNFSNASTGAGSYTWYFGDGQSSANINPSHTYTVAGSYTVKLVAAIHSVCGNRADSAIYAAITVNSPKPILPAFIADTIGCIPFTVHFSNGSLNANSYSWNFGDGNSSVLSSPIHIYTQPGVYSIKLYAFGNDPCGPDTVQIIRTNYVRALYETVKSDFLADSLLGCSPLGVRFFNTSTNATSWSWHFGDGQTSMLQNPVHIFGQGTWSVELVSYNTSPPCPNSDTLVRIGYISADTCIYSPFLIPNVFSPDGDGVNDFFNVTASGFASFQLQIYNRWGVLLFESANPAVQWNGRYRNAGKEIDDGTYYYILDLTEHSGQSKIYKGFLTLIRH